MAALNQAKIINDLEQIIAKSKENFIYDFLSAYGTPKATINRLKMGDTQRSVASVPGDVAVPQKLYFRPVAQDISVADAMDEILTLPALKQHKIRFVLVTDFVTGMAYDLKVKDGTEFDFAELKLNYPDLVPATSARGEKYVRSAPNDTPNDNLLKLPRS